MHRVTMITAMITLMAMLSIPLDGPTRAYAQQESVPQHAQQSASTRVHLQGTGLFYHVCETISGIFDFRVHALFTSQETVDPAQETWQFVAGQGAVTVYLVDGRVLPHLTLSLENGSYHPAPGHTGTRVDLQGSFVSPDNNVTHPVHIYGDIHGQVGVMLNDVVCP